MIRFYCDRCGKEIEESDTRFRPNEFGIPVAKNVDFRISMEDFIRTTITREEEERYNAIPNLLCRDCKNDFFKWCKERRTE